MFDFTNRVKKIINEFAPKEAKRLGHEYLGPEHILLGMLKAQDSVAVKVMISLNIDLMELRREVEKRCDHDGMTLLVDPGNKDKVQKILEFSREEARKLRHSYIGSEHILLALLRDTTSIVSAALASFSITYQVIRTELNQTLGVPQAGPANIRAQMAAKKEAVRTPILEEYARNLTKLAIEKKVDPVIGREAEIERVIQILSRKSKNNPILIGEAGVGKTAVVEGLAQQIVGRKVPESLFNKTIFSLDVAALIAGTKYRGEFEDRIKKVMKEVKNNPEIILFIDEVHTIIGAGAAEGAVDAANILKPALARGELQCIGATTLREYKKYIERDAALERRFQTVLVEEPTIEDTIRILSGLRKSYEKHHGVIYTKESIKSAVRLSDRYIADRFLPDKAIDVIDEAGASVRLKGSQMPEDLKEIETRIAKTIKDKNDMVKLQEYEKAARLRDDIVMLEKNLDDKIAAWRKEKQEKPVYIEEEHIMRVLADWTGIPLQQMQATDLEKLINMEETIEERVVGQKKAIEKISKAIKRARTGLKSPGSPIGSFIFLGPTGVGKTELAKALAEFLFGDEDSLIRFDMSEYMEMHSVSKFIGSPPGYVGYDEGGQITEAVRRKPYSVLLFDEIEKAHPEIQNIMLQLLDEGVLTDTMGNKVDFKETLIIMTSNVGARDLLKGGKVGFNSDNLQKDSKNELVMEELKRQFSPEFLNRIDEVIIFESLRKEDISKIVDIMIDDINVNVIHQKLFISINSKAREYLVEKGYSETYGARPLKRLLRSEVEDVLAGLMLERKNKEPVKYAISAVNDKLTFKASPMAVKKFEEIKKEYVIAEQDIDSYWDDEVFAGGADEESNKKMDAPELAQT
ncbi:MAG: ATP-dependent Clp protease ATP-binding subunit [Spirochaetia bacterium]|nr:ATP-dependent Clp protease ATP-binding subunit [Spirochaetia bacterium]